MVQLFGRITKDAIVSETKGGKKVVNFSIALNDSYKPRDGEVKKFVTFVNCAWWVNPANAAYLTKGKLIEVNGRMDVTAYKNMKGEAVGSLNFHVNNYKLYGGGSLSGEPVLPKNKQETVEPDKITEAVDDLPF